MADNYQWASYSALDPEYEESVKAGGKPMEFASFSNVNDIRAFLAKAKAAKRAAHSPAEGVIETDHRVPMRDGAEITCRVYTPQEPVKDGSTLAVVYHGGGWCLGSLASEQLLCRQLVSKLGFVCVNVDYRLALEHKFPIAVYDGFDAAKWAAANATSFGAQPAKGFIVSGSSAGGNLASSVAHLWGDEGISPPLTGCHLMVPFLCDHNFVPAKYAPHYRSWTQNANASILNHQSCNFMMGWYIPEEERGNPLFSSLLWKTGHGKMPPTFFQLAGWDPVRDDGLIFDKILREEVGVKTRVSVYTGQPHGFWIAFPKMKASQKFFADSVEGVKWLLEQSNI